MVLSNHVECTTMSPKKIKELTEKKHRVETGLFLVEGEKNIVELLHSDFEIVALLGTKQFIGAIMPHIREYEQNPEHPEFTLEETTEAVLVRSGTLVSNNAGIAVARQKDAASIESLLEAAQKSIVVLLDDVRDPGNLGTIIRTADWYGVTYIAASPTTTDFYSSKVIGATMGSFTRASITYVELEDLLLQAKKLHIPVIVAHMEGENIHTTELPNKGFLLMGSESHGVSSLSQSFATNMVTIPRFGKAESLNVSVATGILLDAMRSER